MDCVRRKAKDRVICTFDFTNRDDKDYYLLEQHTPFEGFGSQFLTVTKGDRVLEYDGFIAERYHTTKKHLVHLKAGTTKSVSIEVSSAYNFNGDGIYTIHYNTPLVYMSENEFASLQETDSVSKAKFLFKPLKIHQTVFVENTESLLKTVRQIMLDQGEAEEFEFDSEDLIDDQEEEDEDYEDDNESVFSNELDEEGGFDDGFEDEDDAIAERRSCRIKRIIGGTAANKAQVRQAHQLLCGSRGLAYARNKVWSNRALTRKWFGARKRRHVRRVYRRFRKMARKIKRRRVRYDLTNDASFCLRDNFYGYATRGIKKVYLCDDFFRFPVQCQRDLAYTREGALVHEWSHAIARTRDYGYGTVNALNLARNNPRRARRNAENYHFFYCDAKFN